MPVYRVESGTVRVDGVNYGPGETFEWTPADHQQGAMDRFEVTRVDDEDDEDGTASDDAVDGATDDEVAEAVEDDDDEDDDEDTPPDPLTAEYVESAGYRGLQAAARRFDDVNGNWGEDRLRTELLSRVDEREG